MRVAVIAVAAALSFLGGCGGHDREASRAAAAPPHLYSPNGEPLSGGPLGHPSCAEAIARWFDRVDENRDGAIDRSEYLADARRQCEVMDLDRNGIITPAVLSRYRRPYDGEPVSVAEAAEPEAPTLADHGTRGTRRPRRGGSPQRAPPSGGERASVGSDEADPVMAADVRLEFRVTLPDFLSYAEQKFSELNGKRDGRLTKADALSLCDGNRMR